MKTHSQAEQTVKALRLVWESLESHLDLSVTSPKIGKKAKAYLGGKRFHRQAVKEYGEILVTLTRLL